jgi:hypothetical protein
MKLNNKISLQSLYLVTITRQYTYSSTEDPEIDESNDAGLKKLSRFV